jgi:hypothetical protein
MAHYRSVAVEQGITEDEIKTVKPIVMAVAAGRVQAQFRDATTGQREAVATETADELSE